jgi:hypothetical protein
MIREFMLRWATADETRVHGGGEWQLRFKGGRSHDVANKRLFLSHWLQSRTPRMMKSFTLSSMMEPRFPTFFTSCTRREFQPTK